jgi:hypothetical protein
VPRRCQHPGRLSAATAARARSGQDVRASTPAADRTWPALYASARGARLSKSGSISFLVTPSENASGVASAVVRVPKLVRFAAHTITLTAGARTTVTLRLSRKGAALVRRALAKREKLKAIVTLAVRDAAGNPSATKLSLKLRL